MHCYISQKLITVPPPQNRLYFIFMQEQHQKQQINHTTHPNIEGSEQSNLYAAFVDKDKASLCRFYLRGNCPLARESCHYAHGIHDLNFIKYNPEQQEKIKQLYYNFRIEHPINQLDMTVSEQNKNYLNLYQFQKWFCDKNQSPSNQSSLKMNQKQISIESAGLKKQQKKRGEYNHKSKNKVEEQNKEMTKALDYNPNKCYSLEQINSDRSIKIQIRKNFHQNELKQFLELIQKAYSSGLEQKQENFRFNHEILELEYYRVGFNKLMTRIKISFLFDYLTFQYKGGHFKFTTIMPPLRNKPITFYLKMGPDQKIFLHYQQIYARTQKIFQEDKPLREQDIRQAMIKGIREWWSIPPITQLLRLKHCTFKQFLIKHILHLDKDKKTQDTKAYEWVTDQSIQMAKIHEIIEKQIEKKQYCLSSEILAHSSKFSRSLIENCVLNQRKQAEILSGKEKNQQLPQKLILIKCPNIKTEVITKESYLKPENKYEYRFGIKIQILIEEIIQFAMSKLALNQYSQGNDQSSQSNQIQNYNNKILKQLLIESEQEKPDLLEDYKILQINSAESLIQQKDLLINNSTIVGVDLEGSLSDCENGYLSLIQINNFSHKIIYLIDYLTISRSESEEGIQKCKEILTLLFNDSNIVKIIHDSRNDAQCLYYLLKKRKATQGAHKNQQSQSTKDIIKFTNIFDTAASEQVIRQVRGSTQSKLSTPGLNEVLQKYKQKTNRLKQKYHSIWAEGKEDPSMQRPMSQQFKEYCSMDVVGLPKVYMAMSKLVNPYFLVLISQLHAEWSQKKQRKETQQQKNGDNSLSNKNI